MKPGLGALAVLQFLNSWSNYLWPSVMASDHSVAPFSVSLTTLTDPNYGLVPLYGPIMAGCVLATIPLILVFLRFQRTFMSGISYEAS
jgi:ABC-type glycerol-3-phosphate transport system permease component